MTAAVGIELVTWDDPRWAEVGVSYRRVDYWTLRGYLDVVGDDPAPGSGYSRRWPVGEVAVAARMVRLRDAGLSVEVAAWVARMPSPVEIGPGITITVLEATHG